jgi:hypothetical protein
MSMFRELRATLTDADFAAHPFACLWQLGRLALGLVHPNTVAPWPALSHREQRILAIAGREGSISQSVLRPYFQDVTPETVRLALVSLCERGLLIKWGENRGATYTIARNETRMQPGRNTQRGVR